MTPTDRLKTHVPSAIEALRYVIDGKVVPEKVVITAWLTPAGAIRDCEVVPSIKPVGCYS